MAIIGNINGIPLFSTREEALAWAALNGLTGYHNHNLQGQVGYMGGATHNQATRPSTPPTSSTPTSTPSTNSGGGGGY